MEGVEIVFDVEGAEDGDDFGASHQDGAIALHGVEVGRAVVVIDGVVSGGGADANVGDAAVGAHARGQRLPARLSDGSVDGREPAAVDAARDGKGEHSGGGRFEIAVGLVE